MIPLLVMWSAFFLGIVTSISPCPLATNIAAISFLGRSLNDTKQVFLSGLLYTIGRMIVYIGLGVLILIVFDATSVAGSETTSSISRFLQNNMGIILGPVLVIVGMLLLGMLETSFSLNFGNLAIQNKIDNRGIIWSLPMGILFALSFCPVSASLFFIGLISLSTQYSSPVLLPLLYGIGTAVPVIVFAIIISFMGKYVGLAFNRLSQIEKWIRTFTGIIFILSGIYYILTHIYGISIL